MKITFADIKASRLPQGGLGMCPDDPRVLAYVNEATWRIMDQFSAWGTFARYRAQATNDILVWPREIAAVQACAVAYEPIKCRSMFFEFMELGFGIQNATVGSAQLFDRGTTPTANQIQGTTSKVKLYCDIASDALLPVLLMGYNDQGEWVRTVQGGTVKDGEIVYPSLVGTLSTTIWSSLTSAQKSRTAGPIRAYAYDTVALTQTALCVWDYDDLKPSFRVSYIPALDNQASGGTPIVVDAVVSLEFIPMVEDTDTCLIGNIPALKDMCCAIKAAEEEPVQANKTQSIMAGLALAKMALEGERRRYDGGTQTTVSVQGCMGPSSEPMETFI